MERSTPCTPRRGLFLARIAASFLIVALSIGPAEPSYALRLQETSESPKNLSGLEEALSEMEDLPKARVEGDETGLAHLQEVRRRLAKLPPTSIRTGRILGVVDFFLGADPPPALNGDAVPEYEATRRWLSRDPFPPDQPVRLTPLPAESGIFNTQIRTGDQRLLLSIRTEETDPASRTPPAVAWPGVDEELSFFLEDINTGVYYPWEMDYPYPGSYLAGKTDRNRNPAGAERFRPKPGPVPGDFQLFRLVPANGASSRLEDHFGPVRTAEDGTRIIRRPSGQRLHLMVKNPGPETAVAADVVVGPAVSGGGQVLITAFLGPNGGLFWRDRAPDASYRLEELTAVTRAEDQRGVSFRVLSESSRAEFIPAEILLDSLRAIREKDSPFDAGRRSAVLEQFAEAVHSIPHDVHVALRKEGISLDRLRLATRPVIRPLQTPRDQRLFIIRRTLDGHLYQAEMVFPQGTRIRTEGKRMIMESADGSPLAWRTVVTSNHPPLQYEPMERLFTPEALALARTSPAFRERLEEIWFLFSRGFVAAGSHRFLQYFSRDTLNWLRIFYPALTPRAHEMALHGVLERVSREGELATVEELGDQVAFEMIEEFCEACAAARISGRYEEVAGMARELSRLAESAARGEVPAILKVGVPDVDDMLLPAALDYLRRADVSPEAKAAFLGRRGRSGATNLEALLSNLVRVARRGQIHLESRRLRRPWTTALATIEDPVQRKGFGNWRDVQYGLGGGIYPADVNRELIPAALQAAEDLLGALENLPLDEALRERVRVMAGNHKPSSLQELRTAWEEVRPRFDWKLSARQIRDRLRSYLGANVVGPDELDWMLSRQLGGGITLREFLRNERVVPPPLKNGVTYLAVALDEQGSPVPVAASDRIFALLDPHLEPGTLMEILTPLMLPYPVGLWTPAGLLSASSSLSDKPELWNQITPRAYGGAVVYGWQMEYLKAGLIAQILRFRSQRPERAERSRDLLRLLYGFLKQAERVKPPEGMAGNELWTWRAPGGEFRVESFGSAQDNDMSNPVQLWSVSSVPLQMPSVDKMAQELGFGEPEDQAALLNRLADLSRRYPPPPTSGYPAGGLPHMGIVTFSAMGGGGVNIVVEDHYTILRLAGYPVTLLTGNVLSRDRGRARARALGIQLIEAPAVDIQTDVERAINQGNMPADFRDRVEQLKTELRRAFEPLDVIVLHQMMALFANPALTVALSELAREPGIRGRKRFLAWIHNVDPSAAQASWPKQLIGRLHPDMEYVAVSPSSRNQAAELFGVDPALVGIVANSRSATTWAGVARKVYQFFMDHRLDEADYLWFYPTRMEETKNLEAAVWAAYEMNRYQARDTRMIFATPAFEGADGQIRFPEGGSEGLYRRRLEGLIREIDRRLESEGQTWRMSDKVLFYPHTGDPAEIRSWYMISDLHMFTSQVETFGITVLEAALLGTPVVRVALPETDLIAPGYDFLVVPRQEFGESHEAYGKEVGRRTARRLEDNPNLLGIGRKKRLALSRHSSEAFFYGVVSDWFNIPAPAARSIRAGTRNFPNNWDFPHGQTVQEAMLRAADAGFFSFEINLEGFSPEDFFRDPNALEEIRRIASERGMRLGVRLHDFRQQASPEEALRNGLIFALKAGASVVTVPVRELNAETAALLRRAAEEILPRVAQRLGTDPSEVLLAVENTLLQEDGAGRVLTERELNEAFEGSPVGVSVWWDTLEDPALYVRNTRLRVGNLYVGETFWQAGARRQIERLGNFLRGMLENDWQGSVVSQRPAHSQAELEMERSILDRAGGAAYLPDRGRVDALLEGRLSDRPALPAIFTLTDDSQAGLEEVEIPAKAAQAAQKLQGVVPGPKTLGEVHIFDPVNADVGWLAARIQPDPVVILVEDGEHERRLRRAGFSGITVDVALHGGDLQAARREAALLYPENSPRFYRASGRANLLAWLSGILERYDVAGLTADEAAALLKKLAVLTAT